MKLKNSVYVIAEAGSNWKKSSYKEDLAEAKKMIQVASKAGANAIKFQTFKVDSLYAYNAGHSNYLKKSGIKEDINTMFENLAMPEKMIPELYNECKKKKIDFMSSVFSVNDAKIIEPYVNMHKIASYEINHLRLLQYISKSKKPIILSTGASTFNEIDFAVNILKKNNGKIILLQCTAAYPAPIEDLNLLAIKGLQERYNLLVGFSDHSTNPIIAPVTAVVLGAKIIEKHFTLNKKNVGPDHKFALDPLELKIMIESIRTAEKELGVKNKKVYKSEKELRVFAKRALHATKNIKKGEIFEEGKNFDILRPGMQKRGLDPKFIDKINGKIAKKNIKKGKGII